MRGMKYAVHEDVKVLVEKPDANRPLGRSKCTWEYIIERDCGAVANTAMKLRHSQYAGIFVTG